MSGLARVLGKAIGHSDIDGAVIVIIIIIAIIIGIMIFIKARKG